MSTSSPPGTRSQVPALAPDAKSGWLKPVYQFFDSLSDRPGVIIVIFGAVIAATAAAVFSINRSESRSETANDAFFQAQKTLEEETKAWASATAVTHPTETESKVPATAPAKEPTESVEFRKAEVDQHFPQTLQKFQGVIQSFAGTRAAFESEMALGSLYYNHAQPTQAGGWFEKAQKDAPKPYDRALASSSLGYALENTGKYPQAIQAYESAMNAGAPGLKGDLLLSIARCYDLSRDPASARKYYDQITSQLPESEQAKTAELLKSQLPAAGG